MPYRILLICDHAFRDSPATAIIKAEIERIMPDANVLIIDIHLLKVAVERYHPHLVIMNHLHDPRRNEILDDVKRRGGLVVVMNPEGRPNTHGSAKWSTNDFPKELCDLYLCWGDGIVEYFEGDIERDE